MPRCLQTSQHLMSMSCIARCCRDPGCSLHHLQPAVNTAHHWTMCAEKEKELLPLGINCYFLIHAAGLSWPVWKASVGSIVLADFVFFSKVLQHWGSHCPETLRLGYPKWRAGAHLPIPEGRTEYDKTGTTSDESATSQSAHPFPCLPAWQYNLDSHPDYCLLQFHNPGVCQKIIHQTPFQVHCFQSLFITLSLVQFRLL